MVGILIFVCRGSFTIRKDFSYVQIISMLLYHNEKCCFSGHTSLFTACLHAAPMMNSHRCKSFKPIFFYQHLNVFTKNSLTLRTYDTWSRQKSRLYERELSRLKFFKYLIFSRFQDLGYFFKLEIIWIRGFVFRTHKLYITL
jgi:hypothetical protein